MNISYIPPGFLDESPATLHIDSPDKSHQLWITEAGRLSLSWSNGRDYRDLTWKDAVSLLFEWGQA